MRRATPFEALQRAGLPFERSPAVAFCVLWTTGPDPATDRAFRLTGMRPEGEGWALFDRFCGGDDAPVSARMAREFGVSREDFAGSPSAEQAAEELAAFLSGCDVVAPDGAGFERWMEALTPEAAPRTTGLVELACLLAPGRQRTSGARLVRALLEQEAGAPPEAIAPTDLVRGAAVLVERFARRGPEVHEVAAVGYTRTFERLQVGDGPGASRLGLALALVEFPSAWCRSTGGLFEVTSKLQDGLLSSALERGLSGGGLLAGARPRWFGMACGLEQEDPLPPRSAEARSLTEHDLRLVDDLFQVHLPTLIAQERGLEPSACQRPSQHAVARAVAEVLGTQELLLVHAPTGTGKTLAYLLPALLWARTQGVRVGLATYTRALQEQAMDQEVPRALAALARAGLDSGFRVTVLKGRENYLCWRALTQVEPEPSDDPERWLAWTSLALFALTDTDGDLDRFPRSAPMRLEAPGTHRRALLRLIHEVRARSGCCMGKQAGRTCAAQVARRRAERSHVVVLNHAWVMASPDFVRTVVFDECEHLHDSAASAWEHRVAFQEAYSLLERLHHPSRGGLLDRVERSAAPTTSVGDAALEALELTARTQELFALLEEQATRYLRWRAEEESQRGLREAHTLFAEYLSYEDSSLVEVRSRIARALGDLDALCAELHERMAGLEARGVPRMRRGLEVARQDLNQLRAGLSGWLPLDEGTPKLSEQWWHEVERSASGEALLVARPLAPHELLGSQFLPQLESAAFLSATAMLRGSFDSARRYLGLERALAPHEDEERAPRVLRTLSAPEVFDYARVLVGVPRDAPEVQHKDRFLDYATAFVRFLAERARGRTLVLFTSLADCRRVGEALRADLGARHLPVWYQGMPGTDKEELATLFRDRTDSVLLGVDTFWYGADFPGETLEYLVMARLPYGVPDAFHHAQCALMGEGVQRETIYMPRALAKFRQGFGRLMRRATDRGCVFVLDKRVMDGRHRTFQKELPLASFGKDDGATLVTGETERVLERAFAHMGMLRELERRGHSLRFEHPSPGTRAPLSGQAPFLDAPPEIDPAFLHDDAPAAPAQGAPRPALPPTEGPLEIDPDEVPY